LYLLEKEMAKVLNEYNGMTAAAIKTAADIPEQSNMVVNGTTVECSNISITQVKGVIGAEYTNLGYICSHDNVNKWSYFSPYTRSRNGNGDISFSFKYPYSLGDFAGYDHSAKPSTWYTMKNNSLTLDRQADNSFSFGIYLTRGQIPPIDVPTGWDYVRVKMVITDTTNNRTLTQYSSIQSVGEAPTAFPIIFTDTLNTDFVGTAVVSAQYVNSTGVSGYGNIEDVYGTINLTVRGYFITLTSSNFTNAFPIVLRWYFVQSTINPYNQLVYKELSNVKLCDLSTYNSITATGGSLLTTINSTGTKISDFPYYGNAYPANQWACVGAVTYNSGTGKYYFVNVNEITEGTVFDTYYKTSGVGYTYKLAYSKELSGYPTTTSNL
jgi:hypothetical protein